MLRLEAPRDLLQITDRDLGPEPAVEIANSAVWVRTLVRHPRQAEHDLQRLTELCGDAYDKTDRRTREIEQAYQTLAEGTRYVYDRANANEKIVGEWKCVTNLARQAPWRWCRCHSHPCHPVARPRFHCRSHGHPPRLGASTDLRHIAPVAISPTAGRSRPLYFVSVMLLVRPSPVIITYVVSC